MQTQPCLFLPLILVAVAGSQDDAAVRDEQVAREFIGTWHVTSATTSVVLTVMPDRKVQFILIERGSHGIDLTTWKPIAGGILIEGLPQFRFWKGRNRSEARVEMEPLPAEATRRGVRQFPRTFFMRRIASKRRISNEVAERDFPDGWNKATLPEGWDQTAGHRRSLTP